MVLADEGASDDHAAMIEAEVTRRLEEKLAAFDAGADLVVAKDLEIARLQQQVAMHEAARREAESAQDAAEQAAASATSAAMASASMVHQATESASLHMELADSFHSALSELGLATPAGSSVHDQMVAIFAAHKRREAEWREELARMEDMLAAENDRAEGLTAKVRALQKERPYSAPAAPIEPASPDDDTDANGRGDEEAHEKVVRDDDSVARGLESTDSMSPESMTARMQALEAELVGLRAEAANGMRRVTTLDEEVSTLRLEAVAAVHREHEAASVQRELHVQVNTLMRSNATKTAELARARVEHEGEVARTAAAVEAMEGMKTELSRLTGALEGGSGEMAASPAISTAFTRRVRDESRREREASIKGALVSMGQLRHHLAHTLVGLRAKDGENIDLYSRTNHRWAAATKGEFDTLVVRLEAPDGTPSHIVSKSLMPSPPMSVPRAPVRQIVTSPRARPWSAAPVSALPTAPPALPTSPPLAPSLMPPSRMPPVVPRRAAVSPGMGSPHAPANPLEKQGVRQPQLHGELLVTLDERRRQRPGTAGFLSSPRTPNTMARRLQ